MQNHDNQDENPGDGESGDDKKRAPEALEQEAASSAKADDKSGKAADEKSDEDYPDPAVESGGPKGLEPTRYGDWERKGIISDF